MMKRNARIVDKNGVPPCFHFPYIYEGYRAEHQVWDTTLSLFSMHNETMNIWSHLIGLICILVVGWEYFLLSSESLTMDSEWDHIFLQLYVYCAAVCFLCSAIYHWYGCLSESCYDLLLRVDLTGVTMLLAGSYLPGTYYGNSFMAHLELIAWVDNAS